MRNTIKHSFEQNWTAISFGVGLLMSLIAFTAYADVTHELQDTTVGNSVTEKSEIAAIETLAKEGETGAYLSLEAKATSLTDAATPYFLSSKQAVLMGGRAAWKLSNSFSMGGVFYTLVNKMDAWEGTGIPMSLRFGYGGAFAEYSISANRLIHPSASVTFGAGNASFSSVNNPNEAIDQLVYVIEPQLNLKVNLSKAAKLGFGVSYRHVISAFDSDSERDVGYDPILGSKSLSALSGSIFLQAGFF